MYVCILTLTYILIYIRMCIKEIIECKKLFGCSLKYLSKLLLFLGFQEMMIFALGVQYTQIPRNLASFCPLVIMWISTSLLARGLASALPLFSQRSLRGRRRSLLKFFQMNASLRSSGGCLLARKGVPVLVFPTAGLHF